MLPLNGGDIPVTILGSSMKARVQILVVDDEPIIRDILTRTLTLAGCEVTTANDGAEGLAQIKNGEFDVVISDIKMPEMDGLTMLERAHQFKPNLPSLLVTGYKDTIAARDLKALGVVDVVVKPFKNTAIIHSINVALTIARQQEHAKKNQAGERS